MQDQQTAKGQETLFDAEEMVLNMGPQHPSTHAMDIGAVTVLLYCFREREEILKIFEDFIGARLTAHAFRIGGLWWDAYPEFEARVRDFLKILPGRIDEYETLLNANRIWLQR